MVLKGTQDAGLPLFYMAKMTATIEQMPDEQTIFSWAQEFRTSTGSYPDHFSGRLATVLKDVSPTLSWAAIDRYLQEKDKDCFQGGEPGQGLAVLIEAYHRMLVPLTEAKIIRWANAHRRKAHDYPTVTSGLIDQAEAQPDTWANVNSALFFGDRGLTGGRTLAEFLGDYLVKTNTLSEEKILTWLDAHYDRHGEYPTRATPGEIPGSQGETWYGVDVALNKGMKGLPKRRPSDHLVDFILRHRPSRKPIVPRFTTISILAWAKSFFAATGTLPTVTSGQISDPAARGATWAEVDDALYFGKGGLTGGKTLARFLETVAAEFESLADQAVPEAEREVVAAETAGATIAASSGDSHVEGSQPEDYDAVPRSEHDTLVVSEPERMVESVTSGANRVHGSATSAEMAAVVARGSDVPMAEPQNNQPKPKAAKNKQGKREKRVVSIGIASFTAEDLLQWIGQYRKETGRLPSGSIRIQVDGAPNGLTWSGVDAILKAGWSGSSGVSLYEYAKTRRFDCLNISSATVSTWALACYENTGRWPNETGVEYVPNGHLMQWRELAEYWDSRVNQGIETRSLEQIISDTRLVKSRQQQADSKPSALKAPKLVKVAQEIAIGRFTPESIMALVEAFETDHGRLPKLTDGEIPGTNGITWSGLNNLLKHDVVGLSHASSLRDFIAERRGQKVASDEISSDISIDKVREWISHFVDETGAYPRVTSGRILEASKNWREVSTWLSEHGHVSLAKFLYDEFGVIGNSLVNPAARLARVTAERSGVR